MFFIKNAINAQFHLTCNVRVLFLIIQGNFSILAHMGPTDGQAFQLNSVLSAKNPKALVSYLTQSVPDSNYLYSVQRLHFSNCNIR